MSNSLVANIPLNDIEKIELYINSNRKTLDQIKKETGADYLLNGTLYDMSDWAICCHAKANGKVLFKPDYNLYGYAWNDGSDISLELIPDSKDNNYISCVCLVRNSKTETMYYNSALGGKRGRSAIGTKDGKLFLLCCKDGTSDAKTPENLQKYCIELGLKDAVMLDGGGSSQCDFNGQKITSTRIVQNLILVYCKKMQITNPEEACNVNLKVLKKGSTGNSVKSLQILLIGYGFSCGSAGVDGSFGSGTDQAVRAYQKANGLTVDGCVGQATWVKLLGA